MGVVAITSGPRHELDGVAIPHLLKMVLGARSLEKWLEVVRIGGRVQYR